MSRGGQRLTNCLIRILRATERVVRYTEVLHMVNFLANEIVRHRPAQATVF